MVKQYFVDWMSQKMQKVDVSFFFEEEEEGEEKKMRKEAIAADAIATILLLDNIITK